MSKHSDSSMLSWGGSWRTDDQLYRGICFFNRSSEADTQSTILVMLWASRGQKQSRRPYRIMDTGTNGGNLGCPVVYLVDIHDPKDQAG